MLVAISPGAGGIGDIANDLNSQAVAREWLLVVV